MKVNKNSWHYRVRLQWQDFVSMNAGRKINIDFPRLTRTQYVIDVVLGFYLTLISPIADLLQFLMIKIGIAKLVHRVFVKIKDRKKEYVKFIE